MFIIDNDDNRMFIEMDGEQHDINKVHGIWASRKENIITNDQNKNELASEIGIPLVRIDCYKSDVMYIKSNILNSDLSKILDLSVIDWNKVGDFCYGNFVKNVCEYWENNPGITTSEMAKIFHVSQKTISTYLNKGNMFGWCNFKGKEERFVPVMIKNNNNTVMIFKSIQLFLDNNYQYFKKPMTWSMFSKRMKKSQNETIVYDEWYISRNKEEIEQIKNNSDYIIKQI